MSQNSSMTELAEPITHSDDQQQTSGVAAVETPDQRFERLERELGQTNQRVNSQPTANALLNDPDIAMVLSLKQQGRQVSVGERTNAQPPDEIDEPLPDFSQLTATEAAAKMSEIVDKRAKKMYRQMSAPLHQKQEQLENLFNQQQYNEAVRTVEATRRKYPDFDKFAPEITKLNQQFKGLATPEDLYLLVRARNGKPAPAVEAQTTASERPTHSAARPPERATPRESNPPAIGRAGFDAAMDRVLSKVPVPEFA